METVFSVLETANSFREGKTCWNSVFHSIELPQQETQYSLQALEGGRSILKDFVLGEDLVLFFKRRSDGGFTEDHGPICTMESWPPVSHSSGYDNGTRTSRTRSVRRSTSSRFTREISHTKNYTRSPGSKRTEGSWRWQWPSCVAVEWRRRIRAGGEKLMWWSLFLSCVF